MNPYINDTDFRLYVGDVRQVLAELPAESVDCCVTSPPYWGLRDYGTDGQIGLEATPELFVAEMVDVFRQVRRVLAPHGTLWLNLGDSYAGAGYANHDLDGHGSPDRESGGKQRHTTKVGLKSKDLVGIPWRVAFALQADGWYLRADIIWSKPNPMPESVTDRPTKAHEYVFLLSKQPRYFFDQEAVREAAEWARWGDQTVGPGSNPNGWIKPRSREDLLTRGPGGNLKDAPKDGYINGGGWAAGPVPADRKRNVRSVWDIATQPYPDAHFATFPEALPERCIKAGTPLSVCVTCGEPRVRIVTLTHDTSSPKSDSDFFGDGRDPGVHRKLGSAYQKKLDAADRLSEWSDCGHDNWRTGTVLDPFMGSGTTALVARNHGRHAIGVELSPEYAELCARRTRQLSLLADAA